MLKLLKSDQSSSRGMEFYFLDETYDGFNNKNIQRYRVSIIRMGHTAYKRQWHFVVSKFSKKANFESSKSERYDRLVESTSLKDYKSLVLTASYNGPFTAMHYGINWLYTYLYG